MIINRFDTLQSTNKYCELLDLSEVEEFTVFWAIEQAAGIGQRGNHWSSQPGKNLTFSIVLHPDGVPAARQFVLTQVLSLGVADYLKGVFRDEQHNDIADAVRIKWPNDIYVGTSKICGMLVENRLSGGVIGSSICGIGLNINQTVFDDWVPNPVSMAQLTGHEYSIEEVLHRVLAAIEKRYRFLLGGNEERLKADYLSCLLNKGIMARYSYIGKEITATIQDVSPQGYLFLKDSDDNELVCEMKQIQFLF